MEITVGKKVSTFTPQGLLGPLNDVEEKCAPKHLYVAGETQPPLPRPRVAIVGSRKASAKGLEAATNIARSLVGNGVVVVSGLAEGIDTAAHEGAIEGRGRTIAVLGTPLNKVYPAKNYRLQDTIMSHHLAISQFPIGHRTTPKDFVLRNRTMALVSNASVIVEGGEMSGSLAEGWEAIRLGRPLYIWKTVSENPDLSWPKSMLEYGAVKLSNPKGILEFLPPKESIASVAL
ncbi:MAG: DNA-processing protein DprA [Nitrososphaerales archaeon]